VDAVGPAAKPVFPATAMLAWLSSSARTLGLVSARRPMTLHASRAAAASTTAASPQSPPPRDDFSDLFTETSKRRQPSAIRAIFPLLGIPGMVSFGGGMPNPSTFPMTKVTVDVRSSTGGGPDKTLTLEGASLASALQYSGTPGYPALQVWLCKLQQRVHGVACGAPESNATHDVTVTTGSQDGLAKVFEMVVAPGDTMLVEEASYSGSLAFLTPLGAKFATVRTDAHGLVPESLEEVLASFPPSSASVASSSLSSSRPAASRPRVLYTIPTGSNPTGASLTAERKRAIYAIARRPENNLLILEDDPYYYLRFDNDNNRNDDATCSFLSMDVDSRVVRFDSLSKIVAAGLRLGFVTAPPAISDRLRLHMQATLLHSCALSQAMTLALLTEWGQDGFLAHTRRVGAFYKV
jgi:kynurenine/2-aminoadipate aminotransferase